jgi:hypothetical protein
MNIAPRAFLSFAFIGSLKMVLGVFALNQMSKIRGVSRNLSCIFDIARSSAALDAADHAFDFAGRLLGTVRQRAPSRR